MNQDEIKAMIKAEAQRRYPFKEGYLIDERFTNGKVIIGDVNKSKRAAYIAGLSRLADVADKAFDAGEAYHEFCEGCGDYAPNKSEHLKSLLKGE